MTFTRTRYASVLLPLAFHFEEKKKRVAPLNPSCTHTNTTFLTKQLKEIFAAYNPVSAKVALRPIPRFMVKKLQARNEPRKGRGFGFVTLANEEMQQKAVKEMSGKEVEGREIAVKIAIDSPGKEDAHDTEDGAEKKEGEKEGVAAAAPAAAADAAPASAPAEEKKDAAPAAAAAATA